MLLRPSASHFVLAEERKVARWRPHWAQTVRSLAENLSILAVLLFLTWAVSGFGDSAWFISSILYYAKLAVLVRLWIRLWQHWNEIYIVTDKRLMRVTGIVRTKTAQMPVSKVTDIDFDRSFWGYRLGYGQFRLESAGQRQGLEYIRWIPKPDAAYEAVTKLVFGLGKPGDLPAHRDGPASDGPTLEELSNEWPGDDGT